MILTWVSDLCISTWVPEALGLNVFIFAWVPKGSGLDVCTFSWVPGGSGLDVILMRVPEGPELDLCSGA